MKIKEKFCFYNVTLISMKEKNSKTEKLQTKTTFKYWYIRIKLNISHENTRIYCLKKMYAKWHTFQECRVDSRVNQLVYHATLGSLRKICTSAKFIIYSWLSWLTLIIRNINFHYKANIFWQSPRGRDLPW